MNICEVVMKILNITNGDSTANLIKHSSVTGDVLPWRDPMYHGPFPAKLTLSKLSVLRARYLFGPDADATGAERDFLLEGSTTENFKRLRQGYSMVRARLS